MSEEKTKKIVAGLLAEGKPLSDIQNILNTEHSINITFMELRLLSADLEVNWGKFDPEIVEDDEDTAEATGPEGVVIDVSRVVRPGAMASGSFNCPSGAAGEWSVDNMGQLGINLANEDLPPTEEEQMEFQQKLHSMLSQG